jgi:fibronectin type 3 domain-containing protein
MSSILVTWQTGLRATEYEVWRNTVNNSSTATLLATVEGNSYLDATTAEGVVYYYWLKSKNAAGTSGFSAVITSEAAGKELSPPQNVTATFTTIGSIAVAWSAVAGATVYDVYSHSTEDFGAATVVASNVAGTGTTVSASPDTFVVFWVVAKNGSGNVSLPSFATGGFAAIDVPSAPVLDGVSEDTFISLSWTASDRVEHYFLYRDSVEIARLPAGTLSYDDEDVLPGDYHTYYVVARNYSGTAESNSLEIALDLAPPADVEATTNDYDKVTVSWTASAGATSYKVYRNAVLIASGVTGTSYDHVPLAGDTADYSVQAVKDLLTSDMSNTATGTRPLIPAATGFGASNNLTTGIECEWTASAGATHYDIYIVGVGLVAGDITGTSHEVDDFGLSTCQDYTLYVVAKRIVTGSDTNTAPDSNTDIGTILPVDEFCQSGLSTSGNAAGYDQTFNFCGGNVDVYFSTGGSIKDRLQVFVDGSQVLDSGCILGEFTDGVAVSYGNHTIRFLVTGDCEATGLSTDWVLTANCE